LDKETDFTIVNVFGQTVFSGRVNQSADINIGALTNGHYIVRMANETARFVKN
jgi:Secretion system C-terminal sorting domain